MQEVNCKKTHFELTISKKRKATYTTQILIKFTAYANNAQ